MEDFSLDPKLEKDTYFVANIGLCRLLLMDDSRFPWLILVPRVADAVEQIHYPGRQGRALDFLDGLLESLAVMAAVLGVTIASLILTPFLGPFAPLGLEGYADAGD